MSSRARKLARRSAPGARASAGPLEGDGPRFAKYAAAFPCRRSHRGVQTVLGKRPEVERTSPEPEMFQEPSAAACLANFCIALSAAIPMSSCSAWVFPSVTPSWVNFTENCPSITLSG